MTVDKLRIKTKRELVTLAKQVGLAGWHAMKKDDLVSALVKHGRARRRKIADTISARRRTAAEADAVATAEQKPSRRRAPSAESLTARTKKDLIRLAKGQGIVGYRSMRKEEIVQALLAADVGSKNGSTRNGSNGTPKPQAVHAAARRINGANGSTKDLVERSGQARNGSHTRDLSRKSPKNLPRGYGKDRIITMVRDPYWLHVYWELTHKAVRRTEAALGQDWYLAKPVLRMVDVSSEDTTNASERVTRDIEIHGGVNNWYIDVKEPPGAYRVDIGYLTSKGRFFLLAKSNTVRVPEPAMSDRIDENWSSVEQDGDRIYALSGGHDDRANSNELRRLFEERLRRPMSSGSLGENFGSGLPRDERQSDFHFAIDAELIVYGRTVPGTEVSLQGEPVQLRSDGSFTMRFGLPEGRQILPAVAQAGDGAEIRTVILAIERNTKELEPMIPDGRN